MAASDVTRPTPAVDRDPFQWRFTAPLYMGSALNPINSSLIATALVPIARDLGVSAGRTAVLIAALYLASAIAQPTMGKLGEELGPRRVFVAGILLVLVGGLVGGFGQSLTTLVVSRVLLGIGTSAGYPSAMVLIRRRAAAAGMNEPPGGVLGGIAISAQATIAAGLPIGGVLVGLLGWRSTFFVNVPVAIVALAMVLAWIPRDAPFVRLPARELASRIDAIGILGFAGAMTTLIVFLLSLPGPDWTWLVVAVVLGLGLVAWELRARRPFLDVRLLVGNLPLTRSYLRNGLAYFALYCILYGLTQWIEDGHGFSPEQAGLLILPLTAVGALLSRPVSKRNLVRGPLIVAASAALVASALTLLLTQHSSVLEIVGVTLVFGVMVGTAGVSNQTALYSQARPEVVGTAAGLMRTFIYVGSIASSTLTSIVFHHSVTDGGLHVIALVLVGTSALLLLMTVADRQLSVHRRATVA